MPSREEDKLSEWLTDHPGVEVIARERAGAYRESVNAFRQWVKVSLRDGVPAPVSLRTLRKSSRRTPSSRQTGRLLTAEAEILPLRDRAFVNAISSASREVAIATSLAQRYEIHDLLSETSALRPWLQDAATGLMSSLVRRIRRDVEAVQAALTLPWRCADIAQEPKSAV